MTFIKHSFCLIFLIIFLSLTSVICMPGTPSTSAPSTGGFWLTVELMAVEFQKSCISTALCHQPAFKLTQTMTLNGQKAMMSWPLEGGAQTLVQKESPHQQFVSHWVLGDPEDVSMDCQIAGTDPSFGFARICDETPQRRLFQEQLVRHSVLRGANRKDHNNNGILLKNDEEEDEGLRVQMKGRCFNATLLVKKHTARCPWCPDPNVDIQVVGGTAGPGGQQGEQPQQQQRNDALELQNALILALTGAVVFSLSGFCCAIFVHLRYRKRRRHSAGGGSRGWPSKMTTMTTGQFDGGQQKKGKKPRILKLVSPPRAQKSLPVSLMGGGGDGWKEGGHGERATILYGQNGSMGGAEEQRYDIPWDICENKFCLVPRQWVMGGGNGCHAQQQQQQCAILDSSTTQSLAFSGGIEPLHSSTEPYATCADICQISAPQQQHHQALSMNSGRPPLPPPLLTSSRHSQQTMMAQMNRQNQLHLQQQQQQTFSPNTSGGGSSSAGGGRHDDSGLDSV